jgi:hypothetical protein
VLSTQIENCLLDLCRDSKVASPQEQKLSKAGGGTKQQLANEVFVFVFGILQHIDV